MLQQSLYDYNDAFILVSGTIIITGGPNKRKDMKKKKLKIVHRLLNTDTKQIILMEKIWIFWYLCII